MLYAVLAAYVVGLIVWGYQRIRKLDRNLRANRRETHPASASDDSELSWYRPGEDDPNWPENYEQKKKKK